LQTRLYSLIKNQETFTKPIEPELMSQFESWLNVGEEQLSTDKLTKLLVASPGKGRPRIGLIFWLAYRRSQVRSPSKLRFIIIPFYFFWPLAVEGWRCCSESTLYFSTGMSYLQNYNSVMVVKTVFLCDVSVWRRQWLPKIPQCNKRVPLLTI